MALDGGQTGASETAQQGAFSHGLDYQQLCEGVRVAGDWLEENRDSIEASGEGDLESLVRRVAAAIRAP